MDDLDGWILGDLFGDLFEICRRWWHVILVTLIIVAILAAIVVRENQTKDECRAKGGRPLDTTDHGIVCMKGREIK